MGEGIGESQMEELVTYPEVDEEIKGVDSRDVKHNERSYQLFLERMTSLGGWARVTACEERVLYEDIEQRWGYEGMEVG